MTQSKKSKPSLVIVSDWIRRDLHEPLRHFTAFRVVHLYREAGYRDMKPEDFAHPPAIRWQTLGELWHLLAQLKPTVLQGAEPWATRRSLGISLLTWWYKRRHPQTVLIVPVVENRPISKKFAWPIGPLLLWWMGVYGQAADLVMYRNEGSRKNLLAAGLPLKKIAWVSWATWGVDCQEFAPARQGAKRQSPAKRPITIVFVGKLARAKGVPWLLEAFAAIRDQFPRAELLLAGPLDDQELAPRLHEPGVRYLGIIKNQELPELYRQADIVVAPSITTNEWEEQVGMVNLQAMACGVPLITTRSGAIPEYVAQGEGALLVPEQDSQALADSLAMVMADPTQRVKLGQRGRRYVCDRYEVRTTIRGAEALLRKLSDRSESVHKSPPSAAQPGPN